MTERKAWSEGLKGEIVSVVVEVRAPSMPSTKPPGHGPAKPSVTRGFIASPVERLSISVRLRTCLSTGLSRAYRAHGPRARVRLRRASLRTCQRPETGHGLPPGVRRGKVDASPYSDHADAHVIERNRVAGARATNGAPAADS